jgi:ribosomal protein L15E
MKSGAKRARRLQPLERARNTEYAARQRKIAAFAAVMRAAGRSGRLTTAASSKPAAAAKMIEAVIGEKFRFMVFLDSWCR